MFFFCAGFSQLSVSSGASSVAADSPPSVPSFSASESLRRIQAMSLSRSSYPSSVLSLLHPPEVLLGLGPSGQARPHRKRDGLSLCSGVYMQPHPDKQLTGGADAYFIYSKGRGQRVAAGVADGVGEWDSFGVDPKMFAEELMKGCCDAAAQEDLGEGAFIKKDSAEKQNRTKGSVGAQSVHGGEEEKGQEGDGRYLNGVKVSRDTESSFNSSGEDGEVSLEKKALDILKRGYEETRSCGSATALVVLHEGKDRIGIANVGDSAIIVLRRQMCYQMTCVFRSREQQHQFNCPFQLSRLPQPSEYEQLRNSGKEALLHLLQNAAVIPQDTPETATLHTVGIMEGDLLILGTDGVFDNLFDYEICAIANLTISPFEANLMKDEDLATAATAVATAIGEAAAHRRYSTHRAVMEVV